MSPRQNLSGHCVGVDGCPAGWFAIWQENSEVRRGIDAAIGWAIYPQFSLLWRDHHRAKSILVDMPVGLTDRQPRYLEAGVRPLFSPKGFAKLGPGPSSVFPVPCRKAVYADSYQSACDINFQHFGKKLSKQSWFICAKITELDQCLLIEDGSRDGVFESHPELIFALLLYRQLVVGSETQDIASETQDIASQSIVSKPLVSKPLDSKKSLQGTTQRLALIAQLNSELTDEYETILAGSLRKCLRRDDIVDAMVLCLTASSFRRLASPPQRDEQGIDIAMHIPDLNFSPHLT